MVDPGPAGFAPSPRFEEIGAARRWLEAQGFERDGAKPEWKWSDRSGLIDARLRFRPHHGFYWEFRA